MNANDLVHDSKYIVEGTDRDALGWICECSSAGATTGTVNTMPYVKEQKYNMETTDTEEKDDSGKVIYFGSKVSAEKYICTIKQSDKKTIDFIRNSRGKYYILWMQKGTVGDEMQEWVLFGKIGGKIDFSWNGVSSVGFEFIGVDNAATITVPALNASCWATQAVIPINEMFTLATSAVA